MFRLILVLMLLVRAAPPAVRAGECVVVARLDGDLLAVGGNECERRTLPASTFKIPHALIALQTGVVAESTVMAWDGAKKDFPTWERDHTLDSAIKWSVVWFFQRAAAAIGRERELQQLKAFDYGSHSFSREVDRFWLNGDLTISPREQVAFLQKMYTYKLQAAGRTPPHRCGQGRDDHAGGHAVERLGRSPLSAAVAARHDRAPEDRKWDSRRRARELACR